MRSGALYAICSLWPVVACAGDRSEKSASVGETTATQSVPATTPTYTSPSASSGAVGSAPSDARTIALGDSIFHGQVAGGTCQTCHGPDAKGTSLAPNLTDSQWLNGDGSYQFIVNTVTNGVPRPKQYPAPMPPMGGASLSPDQVRAVAAYVYSLSRRGS